MDLLGIIKEEILEPHVFVSQMMKHYRNNDTFRFAQKPDRATHGLYFEDVIGETLAMNGVEYLYYQAVLEHVPLAAFDCS